MPRFSGILLVLSMGLLHARAAEPLASPIPLQKGVQWVYQAKVKYTPMAGGPITGVQSASFSWTAEIVECFKTYGVCAAVIHAWPDETGQMDPQKPSGYGVLLQTVDKLYRLYADRKEQAIRLAREWVEAPGKLPESAVLYLDLPLVVGKRWDISSDDPNRDDGWYCWNIEAREQRKIRAKGVSRSEPATVFRVAYRTLPSHECVDIVPGIGIVRYEFEHHGTVASADVKLVRFKAPSLQLKQ